ncbi:MAG TPA: GntR family transcriptional regulator [Thermoleophilaceae bacterium]|nr:GntR family transcriptional regulator [Thermoleophilaceae bacterium]
MVSHTHFRLDRDSVTPLGEQLAGKLEAATRNGELGPGDQLPSVRQMAALAGVNVNTVRAVYARLEQRGLLSSEHGRGTFVRGGADPTEAAGGREYRRELMRQVAELERQVAYYTRHRLVGASEAPRHRPASQLLPATELMAIRDELDAHVERLRRDEEERLHLIATERAAAEEHRLAESAEEIRTAGRRTRGTAANPPRVVSGPGAWVLKWRG